MCIPFCKEARERGHGAAAQEPDQKPASEDRHGQQDEEDGGAAAVCGGRPQEQEGHREPGTTDCVLLTGTYARFHVYPSPLFSGLPSLMYCT